VRGARAAGTEGDHPACTSHGLDPGRGRLGRPSRARGATPRANLIRQERQRRKRDLIRMCKPQKLTSDHPDRRIPDRRRGPRSDLVVEPLGSARRPER
jgi:hypothetical protein